MKAAWLRLVCWFLWHDMGYRDGHYRCLRCGWRPGGRA